MALRSIIAAWCVVLTNGEMVGYWDWDWGSGSKGPSGSNTQIGFTGLIDVGQCLAYSPKPIDGFNNLLSVGGGNAGGIWTPQALVAVSNATWHGEVVAAGFQGVAFDIEVCTGVVPPADFSSAFKAVKSSNLTVMVTISHTAPYNCKNKVDLMNAFIPDANIDYMSPQMYSSGTESKPSFAWDGIPFTAFSKLPPTTKMVPSVVSYTQYPAVQKFFANLSIPLHGYIQWQQVAAVDVSTDIDTIAFWAWSWGSGDHGPQGSNLAISFSGWVDLDNVLSQSKPDPTLPTFVTIGGGNKNGKWTTEVLTNINTTFLHQVTTIGYTGIAFDIEECAGDISPQDFLQTFTRVKSAGLKVLVTTSHSAPYGCRNKGHLMSAFIPSTDIDYLSPQLYHTGTEPHPIFTTAIGVPWSAYKAMPPTTKFVPSIGQYAEYEEVVEYYSQAGLGIPCSGYIQWQQNTTAMS